MCNSFWNGLFIYMAIPWIKMFSISSNILHDNGFWYAFQSHMSENLHPIHHLHYAAIWHDYESLYIEMWRWDNMRTNNISQWMRHETMNYISYTIRKWFVYLYIILCCLFFSVIYLFRKKRRQSEFIGCVHLWSKYI